MNLNEKFLLFSIILLSIFLTILNIYDIINTETIRINNVLYYCEDDYSFYFEESQPESTLMPMYNGTTLQFMSYSSRSYEKRYLNYNICERVKKENK